MKNGKACTKDERAWLSKIAVSMVGQQGEEKRTAINNMEEI